MKKRSFLFLLSIGLVLLFFSACSSSPPPSAPTGGGEGTLRHAILSPFNDVLDTKEATYFAGVSRSVTRTVVMSRYKDFGFNYDPDSLAYSSEPYCRIGGQYKINVSNENPHGSMQATSNLYYCKTTEDLIDRITIPEGWQDASLVLYCNDGALINFNDINYDVFTSQMNIYKACVLKNLDLEERNTVLYGFEVGNVVLDDNPSYFFDPDTMQGQVIQGLDLETRDREEMVTGTIETEIWVNYGARCTYSIDEQTDQVVSDCPTGPLYGPQDTCPNYPKKLPFDQGYEMVPMDSCDNVTPIVKAQYPDMTEIEFVRNDGMVEGGASLYKVKYAQYYNSTDYVFKDDNNVTYYYSYDGSQAFFSIKDFEEDLDTPVSTVFTLPAGFDLSRVALFRSFESGAKVYGFETPANFVMLSESRKPVYKVITENLAFYQADCLDALASYGSFAKDSIAVTDTITCTSSNRIYLNSVAIDSIYGQQSSLNLFKNIILDLLIEE